jgi:threonine/homoserine/homoserine lactone efflux protein
MDATTWLAFAGVSAVMIMTPGPDTAVTVRSALVGGRAAGLMTALGVATGLTLWAVATSAGMVALLLTSEPMFLAVRYVGAAYLVLLGIQALRAALRSPGRLTLYTVLVARAGEVLHRPRLRRAIEGATGAILVGLGLRIALE